MGSYLHHIEGLEPLMIVASLVSLEGHGDRQLFEYVLKLVFMGLGARMDVMVGHF